MKGVFTIIKEFLLFLQMRDVASKNSISEGEKAYLASLSIERERDLDSIIRSSLGDKIINGDVSRDFVLGVLYGNELRRSLINKHSRVNKVQ